MNRTRPSARLLLTASALLALAACDFPTGADRASLAPKPAGLATVPAQGSSETVDFGSWNVEWFGSTSNGPSDESLQLRNVRDVIAGTDLDVWGLQEVVDTTQLRTLVGQLPGYAALVANDPAVVDGPAYYSGFSNTEQKVALLYKTSLATVQSARVILKEKDYEFAGRPPVEYQLRLSLNGAEEDVVVIVLHAKAGSDGDSRARREAASTALKSYLDSTYPTRKVWVIGDFNDDVDTSITKGEASPYANFVQDAADYGFPTKALSDAGISSTVNYPDVVDHQLGSNEVVATYVSGSVQAYRVDQYIADYGNTTSDHYPVLARYTLSGGSAANVAPTASFSAACSGLACAFTDASSDADGSVQAWSWSLGDGASSSTRSPSHTYAAAGTYTVTLTVTDDAGATGATSQQITVASGAARLIFNEILANEPGSNTGGEAIEILNVGGGTADIGGWTISDAVGVRHTFAAGTTVAPGKAISVYGKASAIPSGITAVGASSGQLGLNNGGDTVTLKGAGGAEIDRVQYSSSLAGKDGVSMNRDPDGSATGTFVLHTAISALAHSIGKKATGASY